MITVDQDLFKLTKNFGKSIQMLRTNRLCENEFREKITRNIFLQYQYTKIGVYLNFICECSENILQMVRLFIAQPRQSTELRSSE